MMHFHLFDINLDSREWWSMSLLNIEAFWWSASLLHVGYYRQWEFDLLFLRTPLMRLRERWEWRHEDI